MKKTILVIDDDPSDRKNLVTILKKEGYAVSEASDAEEALLKAQHTLPGLAIIDVVMEAAETTGFDVCRKIKTTFQDHPPLVLMVTGKAAGVNGKLAHMMGADGFEAKTWDMAHVLKSVKKIFPL